MDRSLIIARFQIFGADVAVMLLVFLQELLVGGYKV